MDQSQSALAVHVVPGLSSEAGGPSYSVPRLVDALREQSWIVTLRALSGGTTRPYVVLATPDKCPIFRPLQMSRTLSQALRADARAGAILHTHGLWLMPNIYPGWARARGGAECRLVHSPRGMLGAAALQISRWKKLPVWHLWQKDALRRADLIHATAVSEYEEVRAAGLTNPVAIIPNGIDLPVLAPKPISKGERVVLSLGRIHPKKGLDQLLRAWQQLEADHPLWSLRLIGPAEGGHDKELAALARSLSLQRVTIGGPAYGEEKWAEHRAADLFVLPTLNENFAISVAEALASEVPVISTKGAPWAGLETSRCGWWIDHGEAALAAALRTAMALPDTERKVMGVRGREWMERDFGWDAIGRDMIAAYTWLRAGGDPPPTIRLA